MDNLEIRLLTLLPESESLLKDLVCCTIDHFSLNDVSSHYKAYCETYEDSISPKNLYDGWNQYAESIAEDPGKSKTEPNRFTWGDFSALSYTWGGPSNMKSILLNGMKVSVGANLEAALRVLRDQPEFQNGLKLWADALCINQDDLDEKAKVLPLMQTLYRLASKVIVRLGRGDKTKQIIPTIRSFLRRHIPEDSYDKTSVAELARSSSSVPEPVDFVIHILSALMDIMDSPYWMRLWIMQEVTTTSPQKDVYLGKDRIPWRELGMFFQIYLFKIHGRTEYFTDDFDEDRLNMCLRHIKHVIPLAIQDDMYARTEGLGQENPAVLLGDWSNYLHLGSLANVSDERDRVYGLLGLLWSEIAKGIKPDYTKPVAEVFVDLSKAVLGATGSYDELFVGSVGAVPEALPTWAINLRDRSVLYGRHNMASGWLNPHSSLFETYRRQSYFDYDIPEMWKPAFKSSHHDKILSLGAIRIDVVDGMGGPIHGVGDTIRRVDIPLKQPSETLHKYGETDDDLRTAMARVLESDSRVVSTIAARQAPCEDPPLSREESVIFTIPWFSTLLPDAVAEEEFARVGWSPVLASDAFRLFHRYRRRHADFPLWDGRRLEDFFPVSASALRERGYNTPEHIAAVMQSLKAVSTILDRTFLTTKTRGFLGSTSAAVHEGDAVVVPGCSFPVLMREVLREEIGDLATQMSMGGKGTWFKVVGECYVEGIMNGESLAWVEGGELEL